MYEYVIAIALVNEAREERPRGVIHTVINCERRVGPAPRPRSVSPMVSDGRRPTCGVRGAQGQLEVTRSRAARWVIGLGRGVSEGMRPRFLPCAHHRHLEHSGPQCVTTWHM